MQNILKVALETVARVGPPEGRENPFTETVWPFIPAFESVSIYFTTAQEAAAVLPQTYSRELLGNPFDALTVSLPSDNGPLLIVYLLGDRLLTHDSNQPGRLMAKLVTVLAHEIYGNAASILSARQYSRREKEVIALQTGIDFIQKIIRTGALPPHIIRAFKDQMLLERKLLNDWLSQ